MKNSQSGRSMVEILGVLAVMGILSTAGISGYSTAMKRQRVNEILAGIRERALSISTYQGFRGGTATDLLEYEGQDLKGYSVSLYGPNKEIDGVDFAIQVGKLDQEICEQVASMGLESSVLVRPNLCDAEKDNIIIFGFKNTLEGKDDKRDKTGELGEVQENPFQNGPCTSKEEGDIRCTGYMSEKCKMDVNGDYHWVQKEMCLYGCSSGVCSTRDCTGNAQKCWSDTLLLTCSGGQWQRDVQCAAVCRNNRCSEDCELDTDDEEVCWTEEEDDKTYRRVYKCEEEDGRKTYHATETRCLKTEYSTCAECISLWRSAQEE